MDWEATFELVVVFCCLVLGVGEFIQAPKADTTKMRRWFYVWGVGYLVVAVLLLFDWLVN